MQERHGSVWMKIVVACIACVCTLALPWCAGAESARSLVESGNEHYAAGELDQALEAYEKALSERPDAGEILFNKGNALFRKGEFDKAREAYQAAAVRTKDLALEASAHYNQGNALFEEGRKSLESDPKKALSLWGESVGHFQDALRINPSLREAAQNIEIARVSMKDLADRLKQAEEAAKEQQRQREEVREKLKEVLREQEAEVAQNKALQHRAKQEPGDAMDGEARKLASEQERTREKTGEVSDRLKEAQKNPQQGQPSQSQPGTPEASAQEHLEKAMDAQRSASDRLMQSDLEEAGKDQEDAAKWLKEALEGSKGTEGSEGEQSEPKAGERQGPEQSGQAGEQQTAPRDESGQGKDGREGSAQDRGADEGKDVAAGKEQGKQKDDRKPGSILSESPDSILREEKDNRLQLHRAQQAGTKPVDKDW